MLRYMKRAMLSQNAVSGAPFPSGFRPVQRLCSCNQGEHLAWELTTQRLIVESRGLVDDTRWVKQRVNMANPTCRDSLFARDNVALHAPGCDIRMNGKENSTEPNTLSVVLEIYCKGPWPAMIDAVVLALAQGFPACLPGCSPRNPIGPLAQNVNFTVSYFGPNASNLWSLTLQNRGKSAVDFNYSHGFSLCIDGITCPNS